MLCDPVRRSFSHFLHMFITQNPEKDKNDGKPHYAHGGFEFLQGYLEIAIIKKLKKLKKNRFSCYF